jgi:hypothetical protein
MVKAADMSLGTLWEYLLTENWEVSTCTVLISLDLITLVA